MTITNNNFNSGFSSGFGPQQRSNSNYNHRFNGGFTNNNNNFGGGFTNNNNNFGGGFTNNNNNFGDGFNYNNNNNFGGGFTNNNYNSGFVLNSNLGGRTGSLREGNPYGSGVRDIRQNPSGNNYAQGTNGDDRLTLRNGGQAYGGAGDDIVNIRRSTNGGNNRFQVDGGRQGYDTLNLYGTQSDWRSRDQQNGSTNFYNRQTGDLVNARNFNEVNFGSQQA